MSVNSFLSDTWHASLIHLPLACIAFGDLKHTGSLSSSTHNCFKSLRKALWVVNQPLLGSQYHLEEPSPPVCLPPLTVRLSSFLYPPSYCITMHPSFFLHCNYKPYTSDLFGYSYPSFLGHCISLVGFIPMCHVPNFRVAPNQPA